ncbi:hypothetical protein EV11_0707 [Prochlorococcus sp. SS52]|nr:hypothetical protein EV04_1376 [Prochlorococcus marinus str. LG]KGG18748.1 hypothetical protein EV08_1997 [Prochlorococcus marinus str. SS2]KGG23021.1 hypothetical protein EV09_1764 [Prochlorococcus marinus str. SS35]KGG33728.1 hypothetical protein EV10_0163 [Prochlorococcus marinus str. SS51]KGG36921.1 hypothetical protein EV11_0707 [Prochlorococcus sp. SS52]
MTILRHRTINKTFFLKPKIAKILLRKIEKSLDIISYTK